MQLGTAFAVTRECDADPEFKRVLAEAKPEDMVEFVSVAGLPARAVRTPWLEKYIRLVPKLQAAAHVKGKCNMSFDCLTHCGLRDGDATMGQFCIDQQLGHAFEGDTQRGLFFRGAGRLPFGDQIRSVQELLQWLDRMAWMDPIGQSWWPIFGSTYFLQAVKRVRGMKLMGRAWKRHSTIGVSPVAAPVSVAGSAHQTSRNTENPIEFD